MAQLRVDFQGRGKVETFPRTRVQAMRDGVQLALGVARQIRALGQVLAQQAIHILVGAALPGAVRIGKEDLDRESLGQLLVFSHLFPSVVGQGLPQQGGHMPEFLDEAPSGTRRICPLHPGQEDQARRPLHQGPNSRSIAGAFDEVAFPVAGHRAGRHLGGTFVNRRHVGDLAASVGASRPRSARFARLTQCGQQLAPQRAAGQDIQAHIDGLGRELFAHVVRIRVSKSPRNLLGRAALGQLRLYVLPQPGIQEFARPPRLTGSGGCLRLSGAGPIGTAPRRVAGVFAAQGAGRSAQDPGQRTQRRSLGQPQTHGLTVFRTQVCIAFRWHGNTLAHQGR